MKHILILSRQPLFSQGVERLLCREPGIVITGREADPEHAMRLIKETRPDVVIVDTSDLAYNLAPIVMQILKDGIVHKVLGLNIEDNTIHIYRSDQRTAHDVADLIEAIEDDSTESEPAGTH